MNVKDKVAIVTGASSGIGEATSRLLSQKGANVVLASRSKEILEKLSPDLPGSLILITDMTKEEDIKKLIAQTVKKFGRIDILINNAGRGYDAPIESINVGKFRQIIDLDLIGPAVAMREVIPIMKKQKSGAIVNISSGTALIPLPTMATYSSLKRAIAWFGLVAREELKDHGIKVSVVYPYGTKTNFEKNTLKDNVEDGEWDGGDQGLDTPEYVAEKILEAITTGKPEIFAHDWMGK